MSYKLKKLEARARFNHCHMYTMLPPGTEDSLDWEEDRKVSGQEPTPKGVGGDGRWNTCEVGFQAPISCPGVSWDSFTKPKSKKNLVKKKKKQ